MMYSASKFIATCTVSLFAMSGVHAYESDVHFSLTVAACQLVGFSSEDSLLIGSANQRLDENESTVAKHIVALSSEGEEATKRKKWHALDDSRQHVLDQLASLRERAMKSKSLIDFGQYLHALQDHFSHREKKGTDWEPYGWRIGHGLKGHQPDRVPSDRDLAEQMTRATLEAASAFLKTAQGKSPNDVASNAPRVLISALIKAYSSDLLGWNEADPDDIEENLEDALSDLDSPISDLPHISKILKLKFKSDGSIDTD